MEISLFKIRNTALRIETASFFHCQFELIFEEWKKFVSRTKWKKI